MGDMEMGECEYKQRKSCNAKRNCKHFKGGYGKLPLDDVYTCHGLFLITHKFEKNPFQKNNNHKFT